MAIRPPPPEDVIVQPRISTISRPTAPTTNLDVQVQPGQVPTTQTDYSPANDMASIRNITSSINYGNTISNIRTAGAKPTDTTESPEMTSTRAGLTSRIGRISDIGSKKATKEDLAAISSLRPENTFEKDFQTGLSRLGDYSAGISQVDRTIANRALNRFDASQGAASLAQAQRIASNPLLSEGGKQAAAAEAQRMAGSQRAELTGQLAQQAQERAFTATKDYTAMGLEGAKYNEEKFRTDLDQFNKDMTRELDSNIAAGKLEEGVLNNFTNVWEKRIDTAIADSNRAIDAEYKAGMLSDAEAGRKLDGLYKTIEAGLDNNRYQLELRKTDENSALIDAQIQQLSDAHDSTLLTNAINFAVDWKDSLETAIDYSDPNLYNNFKTGSPQAYAAVKSLYQSRGGVGEPDDAYVTAFLKNQAPTKTEAGHRVMMQNFNALEPIFAEMNVPQDVVAGFRRGLEASSIIGGTPYYDSATGKLTLKDPVSGDTILTVGSDGNIALGGTTTTTVMGGEAPTTPGSVYTDSETGSTYVVRSNGSKVEAPADVTNLNVGETLLDSDNNILWERQGPKMSTEEYNNRITELNKKMELAKKSPIADKATAVVQKAIDKLNSEYNVPAQTAERRLTKGYNLVGDSLYIKGADGKTSLLTPDKYADLTIKDITDLKIKPNSPIYKAILTAMPIKNTSASKNVEKNITFSSADIGKTFKMFNPITGNQEIIEYVGTNGSINNKGNRSDWSKVKTSDGKTYMFTTSYGGQQHWQELDSNGKVTGKEVTVKR